MSKGFIKIWRKIDEWEWFDEATTFGFFIKLIMMANWKDKRWHGRVIRRGELITSLSKLSRAMKLSVRQTRTCISKLVATQSVTRLSNINYTHLRVNNYHLYQDIDKVGDKLSTKKRQRSDKEATTTKERKNIRREEEYNISEADDLPSAENKNSSKKGVFEGIPKPKHSNKWQDKAAYIAQQLGITRGSAEWYKFFKNSKPGLLEDTFRKVVDLEVSPREPEKYFFKVYHKLKKERRENASG